MKVLLSAYACEPDRGSESEAGLRALMAAASAHDVWLLTRSNNVEAIQRHLDRSKPTGRVEIVGIDLEDWSMRLKKVSRPLLHVYYERWQRRAATIAAELHRGVGFDVVHHSTFATHWSRVGVAAIEKPLVIGPVGGASVAPSGLLAELGAKGITEDALRALVRFTGVHRSAVKYAYGKAAVVMVQNAPTAEAIPASGPTIWRVPNAIGVDVADAFPLVWGEARGSEIAFVGNLIPLKGGRLAVRALASVTTPAATLVFYGDGPERRRIEREAARLGLTDRVSFSGRIPRSELLGRVASAGAVIHPALHDESPFAVAEALALGTPVVCLDTGGPAEVASQWPSDLSIMVSPGRSSDVALRMGHAIDRVLANPPPIPKSPNQPAANFDEAILRAYEYASHRST